MLTLEERERIAYVTNSPDHALLVEAIEGDEEAQDEIRHERDMANEEVKDLTREKEELEQELEVAETRESALSGRVEDLEIEVGDLKEKIHEAGVDLV